jgi:hypothetical protein
MLRRTPKEVVAERHKSKTSQPTIERAQRKIRRLNKLLMIMLLISSMKMVYQSMSLIREVGR